jgi:hypothetical protein
VFTAQREAEVEETECSTSSARKERPSARILWLTSTCPSLHLQPRACDPRQHYKLDRVAGRAPINTGHHRTAARIERVFPAQLAGRYSRTGPSLHGEEAQACPPCRSEDLLLPLNLPTPAATKGGETDRQQAWSRLEAATISLVGCLDVPSPCEPADLSAYLCLALRCLALRPRPGPPIAPISNLSSTAQSLGCAPPSGSSVRTRHVPVFGEGLPTSGAIHR